MYFCVDVDGLTAVGTTLQECLRDAENSGLLIYGDDNNTVLDENIKFYCGNVIQVILTPEKTIPAKLTEIKKTSPKAVKKSR